MIEMLILFRQLIKWLMHYMVGMNIMIKFITIVSNLKYVTL